MNKKFDLTNQKYIILPTGSAVTCRQVLALKDFGDIRAGELGGWVEQGSNLSQEGNCWIGPSVVLTGDTRVTGNAALTGHVLATDSELSGDVSVHGDAVPDHAFGTVLERASLSGRAMVSGQLTMKGGTLMDDVFLSGTCNLEGSPVVSGEACLENVTLTGHAEVSGCAKLCDSRLEGHAFVGGHAVVQFAQVSRHGRIFDNAHVAGHSMGQMADISGKAVICQDASLKGPFCIAQKTRIDGQADLVTDQRIHITERGFLASPDHARIIIRQEPREDLMLSNSDLVGLELEAGPSLS